MSGKTYTKNTQESKVDSPSIRSFCERFMEEDPFLWIAVDLPNHRVAITELVNGSSFTWFITKIKWTEKDYEDWFVMSMSQWEYPKKFRDLASKLCSFYEQQKTIDSHEKQIDDYAGI